MKTIKRNNGSVVKVFTDNVDNKTLEQIKALSDSDVYKDSTIRVMPDCHVGAGCTIGTTMTIHDKITPNLVGVDIGCGVLMVNVEAKILDLVKLDESIHKVIPSGMKVHAEEKFVFPEIDSLKCINHINKSRALASLGTLGGGNHFIELGNSSDGSISLTIHSGSRGLGYQVSKFYQKLAEKNILKIKDTRREILISSFKSQGRSSEIESELKKIKPIKVDLTEAYLEGEDMTSYLHDMKIVQRFAEKNRQAIATLIISECNLIPTGVYVDTIHNYIDFSRNILRKGAISAEEGEKVVIPLNMADGTLVGFGKGKEDWNYSAPHGAGRSLSRTEAKKTLSMEDFKNDLDGVYSSCVVENTLDEAPRAYKNAEMILKDITPTVDVVSVIKPFYNFKAVN